MVGGVAWAGGGGGLVVAVGSLPLPPHPSTAAAMMTDLKTLLRMCLSPLIAMPSSIKASSAGQVGHLPLASLIEDGPYVRKPNPGRAQRDQHMVYDVSRFF